MSGSDLLTIQLADNRASLHPGEIVSGQASWQVDRAKSVQIRLFWYTSGKGTRDVDVVDSIDITDPQPAGRSDYRFQLPEEPYSFSGKLISLIWAVEVVIEPGARSARAEFTMTPTGAEILLGTVPKDAT